MPELLAENQFDPLAVVGEQDGFGEMFVGKDGRAYLKTEGHVSLITPVRPTTKYGQLYLCDYRSEILPPEEDLSRLFDGFFSRYERETILLYGVRRDDPTKREYALPLQEGTQGGVNWEDDDCVNSLCEIARWGGTIHSHPSTCTEASVTDCDDWKEPEKSGLHIILGRDRSYTVYGSTYGQIVKLSEGTLPEVYKSEATIQTFGQSVHDLLLEPPPIVHTATEVDESQEMLDFMRKFEDREETEFGVIMGRANGCLILATELQEMVLIEGELGTFYIMSQNDWRATQNSYKNVPSIANAKVRKFRLGQKEGSNA